MRNYHLTDQEKTIHYLMCEKGILTAKGVAEVLDLSVTTIKTHLCHIYEKLNVHSIAELVYTHWKNKPCDGGEVAQ